MEITREEALKGVNAYYDKIEKEEENKKYRFKVGQKIYKLVLSHNTKIYRMGRFEITHRRIIDGEAVYGVKSSNNAHSHVYRTDIYGATKKEAVDKFMEVIKEQLDYYSL